MSIKNPTKIKVMTIFGTRPEIIKLSRIFAKLDEYVNHIMVHTGQSFDYEMNEIFFEQLGVRKPDYFLGVKADTLEEQISLVISKTGAVLRKEMPDSILIFGDTNSALSAIMAKRLKIPIFHMEAGNRSFDENVPEETNRRIVDHISDINMVHSEQARMNLLREGIHPSTIFVTGSPFAEIIKHYKKQIDSSNVLKEMNLEAGKYFVVSLHREENVDTDDTLKELLNSLNAIAETYKMPVLVSTHPRTAKRLSELKMEMNKLIDFHKPFGYFEYVNLQKNAFCVVSDSGSIVEEASLFKFPAVQARVSSERPEAYDEGVTILSGLDADSILQAIHIMTEQFKKGETFNVPKAYSDDNVSDKVLRHIVSLTKIVKRRRGGLLK
jgi:UDP-N-acetylglucosamine 2-epimerase (non-hydrolysing)